MSGTPVRCLTRLVGSCLTCQVHLSGVSHVWNTCQVSHTSGRELSHMSGTPIRCLTRLVGSCLTCPVHLSGVSHIWILEHLSVGVSHIWYTYWEESHTSCTSDVIIVDADVSHMSGTPDSCVTHQVHLSGGVSHVRYTCWEASHTSGTPVGRSLTRHVHLM